MSVCLYTIIIVAHYCVLSKGLDSWSEYAYYPELKGSLKVHLAPASWLAARIQCHKEGALLLSPWTVEFTSAVRELQANENQSLPVLFSGVQVLYSEGVYRNYIEGLPGILKELERCGVFYQNGSMGDVNCKEHLPYVCYIPGYPPVRTSGPIPTITPAPTPKPKSATTLEPSTTPKPATTPTMKPVTALSCGEKSLGYEYSDRAGRCYKLHTQPALWDDANATCVEEGARLAVPNSDEEEKVLVELLAHYLAGAVNDTDYTGAVSVGIYWETGEWRTVDGQSLAEAGHAHWDTGEPSQEDIYPYGVMRSDGKLYNWHSSVKRSFVCEKASSPHT